jgi:hypothetical protein
MQMNTFLFRPLFFFCLVTSSVCQAQKIEKYNLSKLFSANQLVYAPSQQVNVIDDRKGPGVTAEGIVLIKNVTFSTGSIDVDIRGRDVFQHSFVGIAFYAVDTLTYDAIYFRPFNFQSTDTLRRKHMVQYISQPDYPWERLRKEHPLMYERGVTPSLQPADWFHAHIVVDKEEISVYVNHSAVPSLKVKKLNTRSNGSVGLWSYDLSGDFANLEISTNK